MAHVEQDEMAGPASLQLNAHLLFRLFFFYLNPTVTQSQRCRADAVIRQKYRRIRRRMRQRKVRGILRARRVRTVPAMFITARHRRPA